MDGDTSQDFPLVYIAPPWKIMGILFVPVSYVIGFLSWGLYAEQENLGFLSLAPTQYLAAGIPMAFIVYISWMGFCVFHAWVKTTSGPRWLMAPGGVLVELIMVGAATYLTLSTIEFIFEFKTVWWFILFLSILNAAMYGILRGVYVVTAVVIGWCMGRITNPVHAKPSNLRMVRLEMERSLFEHVRKTVPAVLIVLLASAGTHGVFSLPLTPSEFGGAEPRISYMVLDSGQLTPSAQEILLHAGNQTDGGFQASHKLSVLVETQNGYLVRPLSGNYTQHLYLIPPDLVSLVLWPS